MLSEYQAALRYAHGFNYLPQDVQAKLREGRVRSAVQSLIEQDYAHLTPNEAEAERGFNDAGFRSASCPVQDAIVIPCLDDLIHTEDHPFCDREGCSCHEDCKQVNLLNDQIEQGLLTPQEATLIMSGKAI